MQLPNDEIGISDILAYRACAQQFAWNMRRHVELPERFQLFPGEKDQPPEAESWASAYGTATHRAIEIVEQTDCDDVSAVDQAFTEYQHLLEPDDIPRMRADLETWHHRRVQGFRLVDTELEFRIPLFMWEGRWIYFRGRIDVLYQHFTNQGYFFSRDYKTSRWPKSEAEVHKDIQQWAYNFAVHEVFPECQTLVQVYDQLRFGEIPTRKTPEQREIIRDWLILQVKAILRDDVLKPTMNDMCHFCPLVVDCRVTHASVDYWKHRLAALAPEKKVGRKIVVQLTDDDKGFDTYTDMLPKVKAVVKVMERFIGAVESTLKELPAHEREEYGFELSKPKQMDKWDSDAKRRIAAEVGDDFFHIVRLTKTDINAFFGEGSDQANRILALAHKEHSAPSLRAIKA